MISDLLERMERQVSSTPQWVGALALVISVALLICSPIFFYMLLQSSRRDVVTSVTILENRIIQCDNNAMLRRQLGITDTHQICTDPHPVAHK